MDAFSRPAFSQRFLNVCQQLEALQPISIPTAPASSSSSSSSPQRTSSDKDPLPPSSSSGRQQPGNQNTLTLPSRERIFQIFGNNERFRPSEEMLLASTKDEALRACSTTTPSSSVSSASPAVSAVKRRSVVCLPDTPNGRKDRKPATQQQQSNTVHVPVGGKARVLPSQSLQRARAALKKRSNALANLQPAAMGTLPADKRRALHSAPDSTWEMLRNLPGTPGAQPNGGSGGSSLGLSTTAAPGKQALIAELVNKTNFSTQSIFQMSRKFKTIAGSAKSVISFDEFRQIMSDDVGDLLLSIGISNGTNPNSSITPANTTDGDGDEGEGTLIHTTADMTAIGATISSSETFLRRLFLTFDVDGDGKIDFREFVVGLNGFVKGTPEEKVHALFEIYKSDDGSSSGSDKGETVAISDLLGLFQGDRHLYQELMRCVDEYFARVELRDELQPTMKEDEFVAASVAEPHLLDMVSRPVPSRRYAGEAHVREKIRAFIEQKRLNWKKLLHVHRRMVDYARCALNGGSGNGNRRGSGNDAGLRRRSVLQLPSTPPDASSPQVPPTRGDEDATVNYQALAIPVADFHRILAECLGPAVSGAGGGNSFEDEALTQSILLAYVATPREKLPSTPPAPLQQQMAQAAATTGTAGTQEGPVSAEGVRQERLARRACR